MTSRRLSIYIQALAGRPLPGEVGRTREAGARQLLPTLAAARERDHRAAERVCIDAIDPLDRGAANLGESRRRAGQDRRAARHRLDDGQSEAPIHRRIDEQLREAVERGKIRKRYVTGEVDRVCEVRARDLFLDAA